MRYCYCRGRFLVSWCVGFIVWIGSVGGSIAQESLSPEALIEAAPAELRTWLAQSTSQRKLSLGSYPVDQLFDVLPPHIPQLFAAEIAGGAVPALDVVASQVFEVPVSDHVHQLAANGDLDDTTRCGRELPFPSLSPTVARAGLKAVWNLLCRNRGGSFEYIAHNLRGSGPNPHRTLVINGRYGFGPQGFGFHALMFSPNELKGNQMMGWVPWRRADAESIFMYAVEQRRARQRASARGELMAGTYFTLEHGFGWEGQYYFYDWLMLGERPVLTVLNSRHTFPQYLPGNRWFPDDEWMLRPAFLVVGKRAHNLAGSGYVALWLDAATFEPLWTVFYTDVGIAQSCSALTYKWSAEQQRYLMLGESVIELSDGGAPIGGTVFEAPFCSILHNSGRSVDASDFSGQHLGIKDFSWGRRPVGCE